MNRRRFIGGTLAGLAAAGLPACRKQPAPFNSAVPSVVLILVDQLRKDTADEHLSGVMDRAREGGVIFNQMRSAASWTYPSVLSMVSGLYPHQHGANGHMLEKVLTTFSPEVPTIQKTFKAAGWTTAAFITNPFLMDWNPYHLGFDHFAQDYVTDIGNLQGGQGSYFSTPRMYANTVNPDIFRHFDAMPQTAPEYTYIHYIDVHGPWDNNPPFAPEYIAATEFMDKRIIEVFDYFSIRYGGNMIFAVTADHGRGYPLDLDTGEGQPLRSTKKSMHEFNIRIPFVLLPTAPLPMRGLVVEEPYSNVDIGRTLLELAGLTMSHPSPSVSLVPALQGRAATPADRVIYSNISAFQHHSDCVVVGGRKHIRYFDPSTGELTTTRVFDLSADPKETANEEDASDTAQLFDSATSQELVFPSVIENLADQTRRDLEALGYLQ